MKCALVIFICTFLIGCDVKTQMQQATEACSKNGGRLATFEDVGGNPKFSCTYAENK